MSLPILDAGHFSHNDNRAYAAELSDLSHDPTVPRAFRPGAPFILRAGRSHPMRLVAVDGGEDIAGWRYVSTVDANVTVLIIND